MSESTPIYGTPGQYHQLEEQLQSIVQELSPVYHSKVPLMGLFDDKLLLIQALDRGIPFSMFEAIEAIVPFTEEEWATYLDISLKTLQRHRKKELFRFKRSHSEKILEITEVLLAAHQLFEDGQAVTRWLTTPSLALGHRTPLSLAGSSFGKELIMAELARITHGVWA